MAYLVSGPITMSFGGALSCSLLGTALMCPCIIKAQAPQSRKHGLRKPPCDIYGRVSKILGFLRFV